MSDFSDRAPGSSPWPPPGVAVVALLGVLVLQRCALRRLRAGQQVVLGPDRTEDLVDHAAALHQAFETLQASVQETAAAARRSAWAPPSTGSTARSPTARWSATTPTASCPGHQSTTVALLDAEHNGVVLSSIAHRESARLYCKQVVAGEGDARALARGGRGRAPGARRRARLAHPRD